MARVLIVDDDSMTSRVLSKMLAGLGHAAECAVTVADGLQALSDTAFDVVLLDVNLPDGNGLDLLPRISGVTAAPEVIIITGQGDPDGAELAIKNGAWDYIEKPATLDRMRLPIMRAIQYHEEKKKRATPVALKRDAIIGSSAELKVCFDVLAQAVGSDAPVLISGETGTGKELFASALHENSCRAQGSFVVVDCAALPENLIESALFGYRKGAFTGADADREGLIRQADKGTLFLDEVGELPLALQKAFLRVLQEHRFRPVGSQEEVTSDFRVIAATNRNLRDMVARGEFRKDLLFRLESFVIDVPPLSRRGGDIKELTRHYVGMRCERYGMETKGFSPDFFEALSAYGWPGNVRELVNAIEWALSSAREDPTLFPRHLPPQIRVELARAAVMSTHTGDVAADSLIAGNGGGFTALQEFRAQVLKTAEKQYLDKLLALSGSDIKKACHLAGLSRTRLYALLKDHGIHLR
jgi:two-component system, NtrC family, response regulator